MTKDEVKVIQPEKGFYLCTVEIDGEDPEIGKTKKTKEVHLVDAYNPTTVESKVKEQMEGTIFDWKIVDMKTSKIQYVY